MADTRRESQEHDFFYGIPSDVIEYKLPQLLGIPDLASFAGTAHTMQRYVQKEIKKRIQLDFQLSDEQLKKLIAEIKKENIKLSDYQILLLIYKNHYQDHFLKLKPRTRRLIRLTIDGNLEAIKIEFPDLTSDEIVKENQQNPLLNLFSIANFHNDKLLLKFFFNEKISHTIKNANQDIPLYERFYENRNLLHWAILCHCPFENLIHEYQFDIDTPCKDKQRTPLHIAALMNNTEAVKYLIRSNAKTNAILSKFVATTPKSKIEYKEILDVIFNEIKAAIIRNAASENISIENYFYQNSLNLIHWAVACKQDTIVIHRLITQYHFYEVGAISNFSLALHFAAESGDLETIKYLVEEWKSPIDGRRPKPNKNNQQTPLYYAAEFGHKAAVEYFLANNALDKENIYGNTYPLIHSIKNNHADIAKSIIIKRPGIINDITVNFTFLYPDGSNKAVVIHPLSLAAIFVNQEIVESLVQAGANINKRSLCNNQEIDETAIFYAAQYNHTNIFTYLLAQNAMIYPSMGEEMLIKGASNNNEVIIKSLLDRGVPVDRTDPTQATALMWASHSNITKILIEKGADINRKLIDRSVIQINIQKDNIDPTELIKIIQLLVKHNVDLSEADLLKRVVVSFKDNKKISLPQQLEVIKLLVMHGAPCENALIYLKTIPKQLALNYVPTILTHLSEIKPNESTLEFTVYFNQTEPFLRLSRHNIKFTDITGEYMLCNAAQHNNVTMVQALLERKAPVKCSDPIKMPALVRTRNASIAQMLINAGSDINHKSGQHPNEKSVLEHFIEYFHTSPDEVIKIIQLLLQNNVDLNQADYLKLAMIQILNHNNIDTNLCNILLRILVERGASYQATFEYIKDIPDARIYFDTIFETISSLKFDVDRWFQVISGNDPDADLTNASQQFEASDIDSLDFHDPDDTQNQQIADDISQSSNNSQESGSNSQPTQIPENGNYQKEIDSEFFKMIPEAKEFQDMNELINNIKYNCILKTFTIITIEQSCSAETLAINDLNILHFALIYNQPIETIEKLLSDGVSPTLNCDHTYSSARIALVCNPKAFELMLERGLSPDFTERDHESLLTAAININDCEEARRICKLLIQKGANVNLRDEKHDDSGEGNLPIMAALKRKKCDPVLVSILLKNGAEVLGLPEAPLMYAINRIYKKTTRVILCHLLDKYAPMLGVAGWAKKYCASADCSNFIKNARRNNQFIILLETFLHQMSVSNFLNSQRLFSNTSITPISGILCSVLLGIKPVEALDWIGVNDGYNGSLIKSCRDLMTPKLEMENSIQPKAI